MLVGMAPLPALPVKAPSSNSCLPPSKPFACHTSAKSREFSTSSDSATANREIIPGRANSFTHISFADPHPLNSFVSYRSKNRGGRVGCAVCNPDAVSERLDVQTFRRADDKSFTLNLFADPHPLNLYGSIFYKKAGGKRGTSRQALHSPPSGTPISRSALCLSILPTFHSLPTFRTRRRIPTPRSLPPKNLALLY
jgi:hypothetical protein